LDSLKGKENTSMELLKEPNMSEKERTLHFSCSNFFSFDSNFRNWQIIKLNHFPHLRKWKWEKRKDELIQKDKRKKKKKLRNNRKVLFRFSSLNDEQGAG
jgi:hypothetical protein